MKQEFKSALSGLGAFAAAATIWMWGYSVGAGKSDSVSEYVKEERDRLRIEFQNKSDEADSLKTQLLSASISSVPAPLLAEQKELKNNISASDEPLSTEELSIRTQETGVFFGGSIEITNIGTNFTGNPLRHQVLANVLIPGENPFEIRDADPGSAFILGGYQIVITSSGTFSATFKVFKLKT